MQLEFSTSPDSGQRGQRCHVVPGRDVASDLGAAPASHGQGSETVARPHSSHSADLPPIGNTGVSPTGTKETGAVTALVDWLGATWKTASVDDVKALLGGGEWVPVPGRLRYRSGLQRGKALLLFDGLDSEAMGVHVEISGSGCRELEATGIVTDWQAFLRKLLDSEAQVSRLDVALDDRADALPFDQIVSKVKNNQLVRKSRRWRVMESGDHRTGKVGRTVYLGAPQSDVQLRIYDKQAEQESKGKTDLGGWVRVEVQTRDERAQALAVKLCSWGLVAVAQVVLNLADFKDVAATDTNRSRWETCAWWLKFLDTVCKLPLRLEPKVRTVETMAAWVDAQVSRTLATVVLAPGYGLEWLNSMVANGAARMTERHLALTRRPLLVPG